MQTAPGSASINFRAALDVLGCALNHLPLGVDQPILVGTSAVQLYTGGAWSQGELELVMGQPRALHAALTAEGFRWAERPGRVMPGLWHPELEISAEVVAEGLPEGAADPTAVLDGRTRHFHRA